MVNWFTCPDNLSWAMKNKNRQLMQAIFNHMTEIVVDQILAK